eukprot:SAG31_NODE_14762_length_788_cov_3.521045_1_plen_64_part_01
MKSPFRQLHSYLSPATPTKAFLAAGQRVFVAVLQLLQVLAHAEVKVGATIALSQRFRQVLVRSG